ncbi:hypothetical protein QWZ03_09920 [Chitinimonas viridis]|uniref:DUF3486 family protein n=1 Tax=Chitinimonas viridis TaxID=664880 RepID=A0ABT8B635_9NEIS|nr:hypothetical protein [Chitinimonas viridis]MDN3577081.1 hypothetical protein [Chitinimonas viridis]
MPHHEINPEQIFSDRLKCSLQHDEERMELLLLTRADVEREIASLAEKIHKKQLVLTSIDEFVAELSMPKPGRRTAPGLAAEIRKLADEILTKRTHVSTHEIADALHQRGLNNEMSVDALRGRVSRTLSIYKVVKNDGKRGWTSAVTAD